MGCLLFFAVFISNVDWGTRIECLLSLIGILDGIPLALYLIYFWVKYSEYKLAQTDYDEYKRRVEARIDAQVKAMMEKEAQIEQERQAAIASQHATEPWAKRYSTSPCPYCGHYKVRSAKWEDKSLSVAFWGIASSKIGTNYKCEHCNRMWE